ncbi:MAG: cysteine hydrolase family protein [Candidatus Eiseniibacteriota bacterium]
MNRPVTPILGDRLLNTIEARLNPVHSALLVIDMQNDFCAEGGYIETVVGKDASACRAVAAPIMDLVEDARANAVPVYWIRANYELDGLPAGLRVKFGGRGDGVVCCAPGSWGADFSGVAPMPGEAVVEKRCYSAFRGTDLDTRLRTAAVRTVVLAGVQTNICIESTLRDASSLGFHVVVAADCVASHTPDLHEATLKNAAFVFGDVLSRREIAGLWQAAG